MICDQLNSLIGFECCPLNPAGNIALISTPFQFEDGEGVPAFAEVVNGQIRFFDDGGVILHFLGRGMKFDDKRKTRFISTATEENGTALNEDGEIEIWSPLDRASEAFAKFITTVLAISTWEKDQRGIAPDAALFLDEVVFALRTWQPHAVFVQNAEPLIGISEQSYPIDLIFDGHPVVATGPHPNAISSTLRKLIDIKSRLANGNPDFLVIIDDRIDAIAAEHESRVVQTVATVMPFTQLERNAAQAIPAH